MTDDEYFEFCGRNTDLRWERTAQSEIVLAPPVGGESAYQTTLAATQLISRARLDGRGVAFGSSTEFILPTRAALAPDSAWVSNEQLSKLSKAQLRKFPPLCPEFVIEVMSPFDNLASMTEPEERTGTPSLDGEGPISGFKMELAEIWAGL